MLSRKVSGGACTRSSGLASRNGTAAKQSLRRCWRAQSVVLAAVLVAAGSPLLAQPAAGTERQANLGFVIDASDPDGGLL